MDESSNDVNTQPAEVQETAPTESSAVENKAPETADPIMDALTEDEPKADDPKKETDGDKPAEPAPEQDNDGEAEETEPEEQQQGKKDANTRIRQLANENRALKQQIHQINSVYQPQTVEELVAEGESEAMAEVKALKQQVEVQNYNQHVTELNNSLESDAQRVLQEFPIFDPQSDEYKPEIAERATALYQQAAAFQQDPNTGLIIGANLMPYDFLKTIAETYQSSATEGQLRGQKATEQMLSRADVPSSAAPKEGKKDLLMEALLSDD